MSRHLLVACVALLTATAAPVVPTARAQDTRAGRSVPLTPTLDEATRREVIDTLAARLLRHYVDADTGRLIANHMRSRLAARAYDSLTSPARFAEVLTTDLRAINDDRHLRVAYSPESPGAQPGPEGLRMGGPPGPGGGGGRGRGGPPPGAVNAARLGHWSLGRVDVLPGNVGYMDIRGFSGAPQVEGAIVAALQYLDGTDAIIFDVRRNGGGSPGSVNFLISHFTTSDTIASLTVANRSGNQTFTRYTLAQVPGPRKPTIPLYVLTSGATASAAEDFSFVLKNMKRATIVGASTAGAGHNNANLDISHGFSASISFTRVMDPRTKAEWERVGVEPDVKVDQASALDVAHGLALEAIARNEQDARRRRVLELTRETVQAQTTPRVVPAATLAAYSGEYEGERRVTVANGRLLYAPRPGYPPETLVALSDAVFALGTTRLSFDRVGGAVRLRIAPAEGEPLTYGKVR